MTLITAQPVRYSIRDLITHTAAAVLSAALAVALTLQISGASRGSSDSTAQENTALCVALANATPTSPAAFRLADQLSSRHGC